MSEETKNTAQEEEITDTPVTEETVENEPEVVENGEAETEEIPVEDGDEEASQDDKKDSKSKTYFFGKKKKEKDKFEQQIEELTDRLKRNMAEFDNFRKRTEKEKSSMYIIGAKDIVEKMLPVVDNFERGLAQAPEGDSFADGMKMIYKQLITTLDELGVKPIEAVGKEFDPNFHNAACNSLVVVLIAIARLNSCVCSYKEECCNTYQESADHISKHFPFLCVNTGKTDSLFVGTKAEDVTSLFCVVKNDTADNCHSQEDNDSYREAVYGNDITEPAVCLTGCRPAY